MDTETANNSNADSGKSHNSDLLSGGQNETRDCDTCKNWKYVTGLSWGADYDFDKQRNEGCAKGLKPQFRQPTSPRDTDWGWRKRCGDAYEAI